MQTKDGWIYTSKKDDHILTFNDKSHRYSLDSKRIGSVTGIGKQGYPESPVLIGWKVGQGAEYAIKEYGKLLADLDPGKCPLKKDIDSIIKASKTAYMKKTQAAANVGTVVHDYMYALDMGLEPIIPDGTDMAKVNKCLGVALPWRKEHESDEIVAMEEIVASIVWWYAGKFDKLVRRKGKVLLQDYKTSSGIFVDHFTQLALYRLAIQEWLGTQVDAVEIVRFGKDGSFEAKLVDNPKELKAYEEQGIRNILTSKFRKEYESRYGF